MKSFDIKTFEDLRALRYFDIFPMLKGQITVSIIPPNQVNGWHRHNRQTDHFFVAKGRLKVSVIDENGALEESILTANKKETIEIQPKQWHGWRSFDEEVVLIYYLDMKHDESDEYRLSKEEIFIKYGFKL